MRRTSSYVTGRAPGLGGRARGPRAEDLQDVLDPRLGVEPRPPDHPVAGPPRPADHEDVGEGLAVGGIPDLIGRGRILLHAGCRHVEPFPVRQPHVLVHAVAHREDHGVARDARDLAGADRADPLALALEPRLLDLEADDAPAFGDHALRGGEEAKGQAGPAAVLGLRPSGEPFQDLVRALPDRLEARADALDLAPVRLAVEGVLHVLELAVVVRLLVRAPPRHRDDLLALAEMSAVVGDVHHDIADAHDGDPTPHGEMALREWRKTVVVIDEVLGVVHAREPLPFDAEVLGALGPDGEDHGVEARRPEGGYAQGRSLAHRNVAEIRDARVGE